MKITYPAERTVSVWIGTFRSEDDFDRCVDKSVTPALALNTDIASICEVGFEHDPVAVRDLLNGFSGSDTFVESAVSAASARDLSMANSALVCYYLRCSDAPADWGALSFLGSFSGQDVV
ncbi:MAG TPA: hypothetical protein VFV96_06755 [Verrucomicrobiae bacterium]|nr:hypothetical protein [Verrucomicrobiae bacterium]